MSCGELWKLGFWPTPIAPHSLRGEAGSASLVAPQKTEGTVAAPFGVEGPAGASGVRGALLEGKSAARGGGLRQRARLCRMREGGHQSSPTGRLDEIMRDGREHRARAEKRCRRDGAIAAKS